MYSSKQQSDTKAKPVIAIFGAGIAGLTTAHCLAKHGFHVKVYEPLMMAGGLARTEREIGIGTDADIASEYSWRGFGPWYHNIYDIMKEIPSPTGKGSVYDTELSYPINFIITPDSIHDNNFNFNNTNANSFQTSQWENILLMYHLLKSWTSSQCRKLRYSNACDDLKGLINETSRKYICSTFGPWIGSDPSRVSTHHVAEFFRKNGFPGQPAPYEHKATPFQGRFSQGAFDGWLIFRRPSNEALFDPWVKHLQSQYNVEFFFGTSLHKLIQDENIQNQTSQKKIAEALVSTPGHSTFHHIKADHFVLAANPFKTQEILKRTPQLAASDKQLSLFKPLTKDAHTQIAFYIAFGEKLMMPKVKTTSAIILVDSEYDITFYATDQLWHSSVPLGKGVVSQWSGTATIDNSPGAIYGLPLTKLTKKQFLEEILHQIYKSKVLDKIVQQENNGRGLRTFPIIKISPWHTWKFLPESSHPSIQTVTNDYPKWVNNTQNSKFQPTTKTSFQNLFLAGSHVVTDADLYSMEGACESGRRVADLISGKNTVIPQRTPPIILLLQVIDNLLCKLGLPPIIDVLSIIVVLLVIYFMYRSLSPFSVT